MKPKRVLITGMSTFWGAELAARLESDPEVEQIIGVDREGPARELIRTDVIAADLRHQLIGKLIRELDVDTVVHAGLIEDPRGRSRQQVHEHNVIGTMNLMAACGGENSPVKRLVVKSSDAIYGSEPDDPSFWTETMTRKSAARNYTTASVDEFENYVREFSLRYPATTVTVLRFASVLGAKSPTPFARLFELPMIPTVLGFDPRLQFISEPDAVDALHHAMHQNVSGIFNVSGDGIVILSQAISMLGKVNVPLIPFVAGQMFAGLASRFRLLDIPPALVPLLQCGRVMDNSAMHEKLGFNPKYSSIEVVSEYSKFLRTRRVLESPDYTYEAGLEALLHSKAQPPAAAKAPKAPRRRRARTAAPET